MLFNLNSLHYRKTLRFQSIVALANLSLHYRLDHFYTDIDYNSRALLLRFSILPVFCAFCKVGFELRWPVISNCSDEEWIYSGPSNSDPGNRNWNRQSSSLWWISEMFSVNKSIWHRWCYCLVYLTSGNNIVIPKTAGRGSICPSWWDSRCLIYSMYQRYNFPIQFDMIH